MATILSSDLAVQVIYPFLLVFVLIFAILQKTKLLGEDKRQVDALVSLAIALIVVAFGWATGIIVNLMPWLAIGVVVLLVFLVLYGFVASNDEGGFKLHKNLKIGLGVIIGIFVIIAIIVATGYWDTVYDSLMGGEINDIWSNILLIAIIVGALAVAIFSGRNRGNGKGSSEE